MRWLDDITNSMGLEFEQALGVGDRLGSLVCSSSWGHKESDMNEVTEHSCTHMYN